MNIKKYQENVILLNYFGVFYEQSGQLLIPMVAAFHVSL